jgi:hypothetical protein
LLTNTSPRHHWSLPPWSWLPGWLILDIIDAAAEVSFWISSMSWFPISLQKSWTHLNVRFSPHSGKHLENREVSKNLSLCCTPGGKFALSAPCRSQAQMRVYRPRRQLEQEVAAECQKRRREPPASGAALAKSERGQTVLEISSKEGGRYALRRFSGIVERKARETRRAAKEAIA